MFSSQHTKLFVAAWIATSLLLFASLSGSAHAQSANPSSETTNMIVLVTEADTGQPISQAHITLQFSSHGQSSGKRRKLLTMPRPIPRAAANLSGINKGTIVLTVTADGHQSYGKELQLEKDNQVFEVKLKKPQPLI